jgi:nucleosome assembly protein 1-like 1
LLQRSNFFFTILIQGQHDEIELKFFEERAALEAKYQKLYEPLYTKRYNIVNGVVEVDGGNDEPASENAAEGKDADGTKSSLILSVGECFTF